MSERLVSRAELARIAGVSRAAITKACKGSLRQACVGKSVDLDHPSVDAYLTNRGIEVPRAPTRSEAVPSDGGQTSGGDPQQNRRRKPTAPRPRRAKSTPTAPSVSRPPDLDARADALDAEEESVLAEVGDVDDDIAAYAHLTIHQVVKRFGRLPKFRFWLDARKKIADIREKELKNDETVGRLIERELVRTHVFGALDAMHRRLLSDTPKTIARELYALSKSAAPVEDAEERVRKIISSQLEPVKTKVAKALRNA